jgi:hypothetical protein
MKFLSFLSSIFGPFCTLLKPQKKPENAPKTAYLLKSLWYFEK